jgi:4-amino-4-deoxy-L-arabinose transferase-like glycosyltransferase
VILAAEPFLILHGARLTTDSFVTLFGAIGVFAAAAALGIPHVEHDVRRRRTLALLAGVGLAGALASKLSFLSLAPFLLGLLALSVWRPPRLERRELLGVLLAIGAAAVVLLAVLWPALFLDPVGQITVMRTSADQVGIERVQFFFGSATSDPGVLFYPVVMAFRSTPWLFVLTLASPVAVWYRRTRPYAVLMLLYAAVPFVVITSASLKYDRYALPLWPAGAVLAALVVDVGVRTLRRRLPASRRVVTPVLAGLLVLVGLSSLWVVPDAGVYANPLLGGGAAAQDAILIGGTSASRVGELIQDREGDACAQRRIFATRYGGVLRFPCGHVITDPGKLRSGDYLVVDSLTIRRGHNTLADFLPRGRLVAHVRRRGVDLADVIVVR